MPAMYIFAERSVNTKTVLLLLAQPVLSSMFSCMGGGGVIRADNKNISQLTERLLIKIMSSNATSRIGLLKVYF